MSNIKKEGRNLFTINAFPGTKHFDERILKKKGRELRKWNPSRSKLGAAIAKGVRDIGMKEGSIVLYLGAGHGFTPSFVSDIIGKSGMVFCVDIAPRVMQDLIAICDERTNMAPILGDANKPETYKHLLPNQVDVVFQDVAQRNQVEIFLKNVNMYLKKDGIALLALKARSVDVTKKPSEVFMETEKELRKNIKVLESRTLNPFEKDHCFYVCKKL